MRRTAIAALALGALVVTGCAGDPDNGGDPTSAGPIVVAIPGDIDNFDPHTNQQIIFEYSIRELVFSSLVSFDVDLNLEPDLATYEVNEDATEFTFELNPDAVFHDGTPVNADAVIESLERAGSAEDSIWSGRLADVASYEAPDEDTVVITLNSPDASFLSGLASIAIMAPSSFDDATSTPVGSGPFTFTSWAANTEIVLDRFADYYGDAGASEQIVLRPTTDEQVALNNLYSGDIDIIASVTSSAAEQVDTGRAQLVEPASSNRLSLIEYNSSGVLSDPLVRQALAHALDKEAIRDIAYGGGGSPAWSPLPENSWAFSEQEGYEYDLDRARELLDEAGVEDLSFTLDILSGYPEAEQIARVWQSSLAEIGVTLTPNVTEMSVWLDAYVSRDYDAIWNAFNVSVDPHSYFDIIMNPHLNDDYQNQEVSDLVAESIATPDEAERAEIYAQLQKILVDELPVMVVQSTPIYSVAATDVEDYSVNPLSWPILRDAVATN
ncbi:ABC transporter substrate-binding protein [Leucobacter sp. CSA1]|uniref:ABC transporter substrate-binding protein n=1 Tax=Leucobacter chromiisoli TaxID=2796471 RepID=A0A934QAB1_9MICO|nr:ABC transporter substrate-binding protein [Leucobacter chromiisoli]MBK0420433.1 ABC transporter substrate-binding protein [Leucobacter chromiisoli]